MHDATTAGGMSPSSPTTNDELAKHACTVSICQSRLLSSSTEPKLITAAVAASVSAGTHSPLTSGHSARLRLGTGGGFSFFGFLVEGAASASATAFFDDAFFAASSPRTTRTPPPTAP